MTVPVAGGASGTTDLAQSTGQVPQPSPAISPAAPSSGTSEPTTTASPDGLTAEQLRDALAKARKEAAEHRVKLNEFEAAAKKLEDAKLSETERLSKRVAELEKADADRTRATQERIVRAEVKAAASGVGIKPELAARLIDYSEIEFDDDGEPKNLAKLLKKLAETYPELVAQPAPAAGQPGQPVRPAATSGGPSNPGRAASGGAVPDLTGKRLRTYNDVTWSHSGEG